MSDQELEQEETAEAVPADQEQPDAAQEEVAPAEEEKTYEERAEELRAELRRGLGDWYVVHTYAYYEKRVKSNLETRIQTQDMEEHIFEIDVPMEEVVEIKNTQRKIVNRVRIPGYVVVRMDLTDESWGVVRHTPGVTGFVGNAHDPQPLSTDEVFQMLRTTASASPASRRRARPEKARAALLRRPPVTSRWTSRSASLSRSRTGRSRPCLQRSTRFMPIRASWWSSSPSSSGRLRSR